MHHAETEQRGSVVDRIVDGMLYGAEPAPHLVGINTVRCTIDGTAHCWHRAPPETPSDFLALALAEAGRLGARSVTFEGIAPVPQPQPVATAASDI
jgi:hypothetical protein